MHILDRLPRETGREYALRIIKENIINLELAPGSQISENELSAEMGLSRTPVREALIELSKVKIVEIHPQKRSVVSLIDYDLVEESRFMRHLLECAVVQLDCEMASPEDIKRLQENVQLQNFYLDNFYTEQLLPLDNAFHGILFDIARKSQIFSLMSNISIHFDRVRSMALSSVKNLKIVQDHENIVSAIARRDAAQARDLMEQHLSRYKIDAAAIREKYPQYFV
ncbi:GntR family transcriptional regulator [uncultured Oscillibacter sp.]|uniref:GntR family transcriptional regulator n=1 Tax=uncultured Oscillibacter sp. TaxID=876091 RepID=UPI0025EC1018|nr:GntR family transcriptional regulator [uncultured Oscillibacter sp.]